MVTNHKQTCIIHFVDCRKALHSYFTHHTRKYFGCERRRGLHGGRHVVARVDVLGTTCATGGPLGLASGKLPSAHIASYEKGRCCQAPPCGETVVYVTLWRMGRQTEGQTDGEKPIDPQQLCCVEDIIRLSSVLSMCLFRYSNPILLAYRLYKTWFPYILLLSR